MTEDVWEWEFLEAEPARPCAICGQDTNRVDFDFETNVCSLACIEALWVWFQRDLRARPIAPYGDPF